MWEPRCTVLSFLMYVSLCVIFFIVLIVPIVPDSNWRKYVKCGLLTWLQVPHQSLAYKGPYKDEITTYATDPLVENSFKIRSHAAFEKSNTIHIMGHLHRLNFKHWFTAPCTGLWVCALVMTNSLLGPSTTSTLFHYSIWFFWFDTINCLSNLSCELWNRKLKINKITLCTLALMIVHLALQSALQTLSLTCFAYCNNNFLCWLCW